MQHFLLGYLLNAAWQIPLIALGGMVFSRAAKLAPREACWAWIGLLALAVVLPALKIQLPALPPARTAGAATAAWRTSSSNAAELRGGGRQ